MGLILKSLAKRLTLIFRRQQFDDKRQYSKKFNNDESIGKKIMVNTYYSFPTVEKTDNRNM